MLTTFIAIASIVVLVAELWTGIAVCGFSSENDYIERSVSPGPYWLFIGLHAIVAIGLPLLSYNIGL